MSPPLFFEKEIKANTMLFANLEPDHHFGGWKIKP
jgi:hypothetical protein